MLLLFVYPFLYGLALSFNPKEGGALANYSHFRRTIWVTIWITLTALPATLINVGFLRCLQDASEDTIPALDHDDSGGADYARHRAHRRGMLIYWPSRLAVANAAVSASV
jgi:hypothetical protein